MTTGRKEATRKPRDVRETVEEVWLAGLGALALAEEKGSGVFRTLRKRGERLEHQLVRRGAAMERTIERGLASRRSALAKAGRTRLQDARTRVETIADDAARTVERGVDEAMTRVLHRIGVPTTHDVTALTRRVEALRATLVKRGAPAKTAKPRKGATAAVPTKPAATKRRHAAARQATRRVPARAPETPALAVPLATVGADV